MCSKQQEKKVTRYKKKEPAYAIAVGVELWSARAAKLAQSTAQTASIGTAASGNHKSCKGPGGEPTPHPERYRGLWRCRRDKRPEGGWSLGHAQEPRSTST